MATPTGFLAQPTTATAANSTQDPTAQNAAGVVAMTQSAPTGTTGIAPGFLASVSAPVASGGSVGGQNSTPVVPKGEDSVQGQLNNMLDQNSDYMSRARSRGLQVANSRGLINSSTAAEASEAAAMDAAMPAAQQDAQFSQQKSQIADQYAQERSLEQYKQDNLAYAQFLQGVGEINKQDMSQTQKDQAVKSLWDMYLQGRPVASSLSGVQIKDGHIIYPETPPAPATMNQAASNSQAGYNTIASMPPDMRLAYTTRYGNLEPQIVNGVQGVIDYAKEKFKDYIKPGLISAWGTSFNDSDVAEQYRQFVRDQLAKAGLPADEATIAKVVGYTPKRPIPVIQNWGNQDG